MALPQSLVRVQQEEQKVTVQIEGWGRMHQGLALRRFGEHCLAEKDRGLRVDLRHCTYMDSTFLGTLVFLHHLARRRHGDFVLISPSSQCCRLIKQLGMDDIFSTRSEEETASCDWTELPCGIDDPKAFNRHVVQAHQELANLSGPAGETFRQVAKHLSQDAGVE